MLRTGEVMSALVPRLVKHGELLTFLRGHTPSQVCAVIPIQWRYGLESGDSTTTKPCGRPVFRFSFLATPTALEALPCPNGTKRTQICLCIGEAPHATATTT